jgi:hypothetical protein
MALITYEAGWRPGPVWTLLKMTEKRKKKELNVGP